MAQSRFRRMALGRTLTSSKTKAKLGEAMNALIETSEIGFTVFAFGLAQGKYGGVAYRNVPIDLLAGVALHIGALFPQVKGFAPHMHAVANGALASFLGGVGRQVGRGLQTDADRERIIKNGGAFLPSRAATMGLSGGASLADEELSRMVAAGKTR
jgi:hypothetical protein